jgi:hypothetical protein
MTVKEPSAEILAGDVLRATYEIKYRHYAFNVKVVGGRVEFYLSGLPELVAFIRPGSATTGAMWIGDECIAEYEGAISAGTGSITPVRDGRKDADATVEGDPIVFLLDAITGRRDGR